jgi:hypothetical protein
MAQTRIDVNTSVCKVYAAYNPRMSRPFVFAACAIVVALTYDNSAAGPVDQDVERALATARVKAAAGDVVAQFSLGAMLYYGDDD